MRAPRRQHTTPPFESAGTWQGYSGTKATGISTRKGGVRGEHAAALEREFAKLRSDMTREKWKLSRWRVRGVRSDGMQKRGTSKKRVLQQQMLLRQERRLQKWNLCQIWSVWHLLSITQEMQSLKKNAHWEMHTARKRAFAGRRDAPCQRRAYANAAISTALIRMRILPLGVGCDCNSVHCNSVHCIPALYLHSECTVPSPAIGGHAAHAKSRALV